MKHIEKRAVCMALALLMLVSLVPFAFADGEASYELRLGVSNYYIQVPASYERGLMTAEDVADNQVGYYVSEESSLDFDVYQFSKEDEPAVLAEYAAKEAAEYGAEPVSATLNGSACCYYDAVEENEGESYPTRTYILDTGAGYVELVFWLDGETAEAEMEAIIGTVQLMRSLRLGSSDFYVNIPDSYTSGDMSEEDVADGQVGYYVSEESLLDFDVYQFSKEDEPAALEDYAAEEAAEYEAAATVGEINGVAVASYDAVEENEGESYPTRTYILDTGADYVELVFWLDGETAEAEALRIMRSLSAKITVALGSSPYSITVPDGYTEGEMTEEDIAEGQVAYFRSALSLLDFDVYQLAKEDASQSLADFAAAKAAELGVPTTDTAINGVSVSYYRAQEDFEGVTYKVLVFVLDADDSFIVLRFWLDGDTAADEAMGIIRTIK